MINNTFGSLAAVVVLILLTLWVRRTSPSAFFVVLCHNGVWAGALLLISTNLIRYDEASLTAWLVLGVSLVLFNVGAGLSGYIRLPSRGVRNSETSFDDGDVPDLAIMGRTTFFVLMSLYIAAFVTYVIIQVVRAGSWTQVVNVADVRDIDGISNLEATPLVVRVFFYLGPILFTVLAFKEGMKNPLPLAVRLGGVAVVAFTMIALLQRTNVFLSVLIWLALVLTRHFGTRSAEGVTRGRDGASKTKRITPQVKIGAIVVVGLLLMFGTFQVIAVTLGKNATQALASGNVSAELEQSGLTSIYTYYTGGVPAFLQLVDSNDRSMPPPPQVDRAVAGEFNPTLWGAATFGAVARFIPGATFWDPIEPFIDMGVAINVYTWNGPIYRDFRVIGLGITMLAAGLLISVLHAHRYRSARFYWLQATLLSAVFLATFASVTQWGNIMIVFYVLIFALTANWTKVNQVAQRKLPRLGRRKVEIEK